MDPTATVLDHVCVATTNAKSSPRIDRSCNAQVIALSSKSGVRNKSKWAKYLGMSGCQEVLTFRNAEP